MHGQGTGKKDVDTQHTQQTPVLSLCLVMFLDQRVQQGDKLHSAVTVPGTRSLLSLDLLPSVEDRLGVRLCMKWSTMDSAVKLDHCWKDLSALQNTLCLTLRVAVGACHSMAC